MMLPLRIALAACLLAAVVLGQSRLPTQRRTNHPQPTATGGFGTSVEGLGDIDGDGFADYAVSAPNFSPTTGSLGRVYVVSGRTGAFVLQISGIQSLSAFGQRILDVGDVTGDGVRDLAISAPGYDPGGMNGAGRVQLHSGANGSLVWAVNGTQGTGAFGTALGAIGTGGVAATLVVGEPGRNLPARPGAGRVVYLDAATGTFAGAEDGPFAFDGFGRSVAARLAGPGLWASSTAGRVYALSGPLAPVVGPTLFLPPTPGSNDTPQLALVVGPTAGASGLVVGRYFADPGGVANAGTVEFFGGGSATPTLTISGTFAAEAVGRDCIAVADFDGDGEEEIGFSSADAGAFLGVRFRIVDLAGVVREDVARAPGGQRFGSLADVTGDGRGEWIGGIASGLSQEFEVALFSLGLEAAEFTTGPGGTVVDQVIGMTPTRGGALYLQLYSGTGSSPGLVPAAGAPLVPIVPDAVTNITLGLTGGPDLPTAVGFLDPNGFATTSFLLAPAVASALSGLSLFTTAIVFDASLHVAGTTNPRRIVFP